MPVITSTSRILDSAGKPANGSVMCRVTEGFSLPIGEITRTGYRSLIIDGTMYASDGSSSLTLPATPPGYHMVFVFDIYEMRDGVPVKAPIPVTARDIPDVASIEWADLPVSDGFGPAGRLLPLEPADTIPASANPGDMFIEQSGRFGRLKEAS